jgi:hypothetical protein
MVNQRNARAHHNDAIGKIGQVLRAGEYYRSVRLARGVQLGEFEECFVFHVVGSQYTVCPASIAANCRFLAVRSG